MMQHGARAGWLKMGLLSAAILLAGVAAAFGMEAWNPAYTHKVQDLPKEMLTLTPGYESTKMEMTLYPWNLYDKADCTAPGEQERQYLEFSLSHIEDFLRQYSEGSFETFDAGQMEQLISSFEKLETGGLVLYFLKEQAITLSGTNASYRISFVCDEKERPLYLYCRDNSGPDRYEQIEESAIHEAVEAAYDYLLKLNDMNEAPSEFGYGVGYWDQLATEVIKTDREVLVVCKFFQQSAQMVFMFDPLHRTICGYSLQD